MKRAAPILAALAAILTAAGGPVRTATENFVTNKIAEAEARTAAAITAATNAIPRPDLTPATNYTDYVKDQIVGGLYKAGRAGQADRAYEADTAGSASRAETADLAYSAMNADSAMSADSAQYADTAYVLATTESGGEDYRTASTIFQQLDNAATKESVTNIVRDLSLGGIWDEELQVWWTPRMRNGSLTYEATTNVNLNAED